MAAQEHEVLIAGAGPTGMMLAAELALAGVGVAILERSVQREGGSRSGGLHARTIEILDQRGIAERFLAEGKTMQVNSFAMVPLDISDFPARHNYGLALWQNRFEEILAGWVDELGVPTKRGLEVTGFEQDETGVEVQIRGAEQAAGDQRVRTRWLVGCDGGRSTIRKAAGIAFPGWEPSVSSIVAEAEMSEEPEPGLRRDENGISGIGKLDDDGRVRIVVREAGLEHEREATLEDLRRALIAVWGTDYGLHSPTWISRFTDTTRQAATYRAGRVLIAGDAAHIHYPVGGQGMSTGLQDAVNLGWKLAQVLAGTSPESLLDTYQGERHPAAAQVLRTTMAQTLLTRSDPRIDALRDTLAELVAMEEPRKHLGGMLSGLGLRYDLGEGHPLLGGRVPDLDLVTDEGEVRLYALMHEARPLLLDLAGPGLQIAPWADRVRLVSGRYEGPWELPVVGPVEAPAAVLVRPDGHVAWVGDGTDAGLAEALTRWFGPPR